MKKGIILILALLIVGCGPIVWKHPEHNDQSRFQNDVAECKQYADKMSDPGPDNTVYKNQSSASGGALGRAVGQAISFRIWFKSCMTDRGYYEYKGKPETQVAEE